MIVDAQNGSTVSVLVGPERPRPVRRDHVGLLPRRQRAPLGRDAEVAALAAAIRGGGPVQVWGGAGVGKSTLLRHAAWLLEPGPDGVVFLAPAHGDVGDLAQEIFEACYDAPGYAPARGELRRLMTGVRVTVYIDNADFPPAQLPELFDAAPDATFVLASAERSLGNDGTAWEITGLQQAAGLELLARELRRPLRDGEARAAVALWQAAAGRPLPLLRAAALTRFGPDGGAWLPRPGDVPSLLPSLLDHVGADAGVVGVLRLLATLGNAELAPAHIGALADVPDAAGMCERLSGLGLLDATERGYRCAADAERAVRARLSRPFPVDRLCAHLIAWAADPGTAPADVAAQAPLLERAADLAERAGRSDLAVGVARASSAALARSLRLGAWGRLLGRGWGAARRSGDRRAEAFFLREEGVRALLIGRRVVSAVLVAQAAWLGRELLNADAAETAPAAPRPDPPAPEVPAPEAPLPEVPAPEVPAPEVPAPEVPLPEVPLPEVPLSEAPLSEVPDPQSPAQDIDVVSYMADNGYTPADPAAPPDPWGGLEPPPSAPEFGPPDVGTPSTGTPSTGTPDVGTPDVGSWTSWAGDGAASGAQSAVGAGTVGTGGAVMSGALVSAIVGGALATAVAAVIGVMALTGDSDPEPENTGLAGTWVMDTGGVWEISADGQDTYAVASDNAVCGLTSFQLTGGDGRFTGMQPWYDLSTCASLGEGAVTLDLAPDGATAEVEVASPPGQPPCEIQCTATLTRQDDPL
ncbi:ATP-binding protein [Streptomyces sp. PT12]|uniref:ATP-binding protein n=1 Tax=Streptomyces sp. PT12 TaxID=1510197 RepID=UPI0011BF2E5F|nr:ATP-binding protein [Streptomyces sp. PT12]